MVFSSSIGAHTCAAGGMEEMILWNGISIHVHVPHDVAVAGIAAGPDHEPEIRRNDFVQYRNDATARLGVAAVQKSEMSRVKTAFECL
jgi:hypothetical protein